MQARYHRFLTILFLMIACYVPAQIAFANGWNATTSVPNVTTAATGSNRLLLYIITFEDDDNTNDVTAVSYGGQAMTQAVQSTTITTASSQSRVEIFYLLNAGISAATNTTFVPVFSISNPTVAHGYYTMVVTLTGVNQSTPICSVGTGERLNSTTVSLASGISVLPNEVLIYATHNGGGGTHTPSTGFTERVDLNGAGGGQGSSVNTSSISVAATINPTSTASASQNRFVMAMVRIIPAGATCSFALPIELLTFDVALKEDQVKIDWQTASENHNDFFTIQQSSDGELWQDIKEVKSKGESRVLQKYLEYLPLPEPGLVYYRLKQTDYDGTVSFSWIRELMYGQDLDFQFKLQPNPAKDELIIKGKGLELSNIKVIDLLGQDITKQVSMIQQNPEQIEMDVSGLQGGTYFISIKSQYKSFVKN